MDRGTLRALIVEYRDKEGLSFGEIAGVLRDKHGIIKDRQSVHGIYVRTKEKLKREEERYQYDITITADVVNLYCLGYNMSEIEEICKNQLNNDISYYKVRTIINKEEEFIEDVKRTLMIKAIDYMVTGKGLEDFKESISYKGIQPNEKGLKSIFEDAGVRLCIHAVESELRVLYREIEDINVIRQIISRLEIKGVDEYEIRR